MSSQLWTRKPLKLLYEEMAGENRLRRILGPVQLTSLGVGAIIGTGIFVLVGQAAHDKTGFL
jgi:APA family basic amino acid/polyamine antiporter